MKKLNYKQAFDKITDAYIKDEIKPMDAKFCFCGTLCDKSDVWFLNSCTRHRDAYGYIGADFVKMETALFDHVYEKNDRGEYLDHRIESESETEQRLFNGMCAALEVLKQIHKDRGENVEDFEFVKRELV